METCDKKAKIQKIKNMLKEGYTLREIGEKFGISKQAVSQFLMKNGVYAKQEKIFLKSKLHQDYVNQAVIEKINKLEKKQDELRLKVVNLENTLKLRDNKISKLQKELDKYK